MMEKVLNSVQEMQTFAKNLAKKIPGGTIIALIGNLGSGKTTFSQGLPAAWAFRILLFLQPLNW